MHRSKRHLHSITRQRGQTCPSNPAVMVWRIPGIGSHSDGGRNLAAGQPHQLYRTPAAPRTPSRLPPSVLPTANW